MRKVKLIVIDMGLMGMEKDDELKGAGNSYTTYFRLLDPRIGRWFIIDPLESEFPWQSPYVAFDNNPIFFVDPKGASSKPNKYQGHVIDAAQQIVGTLKFPTDFETRAYNSNYFVPEISNDGRTVLKINHSNTTPSRAIMDIYKNAGDYQLDCAEYIQYCHLYAKLKTMGAKKFDKYYNENSNPLTINDHKSPGIKTKQLYYRVEPKGSFRNESGTPTNSNVGKLISSAPAGSRIAVTNLDAPNDSSFKNENFIKVSNNEYIAHPLGDKLTIGQIADKMAKMTYDSEKHGDDFEAYKRENIFISEIEIYEED